MTDAASRLSVIFYISTCAASVVFLLPYTQPPPPVLKLRLSRGVILFPAPPFSPYPPKYYYRKPMQLCSCKGVLFFNNIFILLIFKKINKKKKRKNYCMLLHDCIVLLHTTVDLLHGSTARYYNQPHANCTVTACKNLYNNL